MGYPNQPGWQPMAPPAPVYAYAPPTNGMAVAALIIGYLQLAVMVGVVLVAAILVGFGAQ